MTTSTDKNPTFSYGESGTYDVSLKVTLPSGKNTTVHQTIDVFLLSDVSYTYETDDCATVTFTDTSIAPSIVSWHWLFDDGTESFDQNPVHVFPFAFNFGVSLTIRTEHGGIGFTSQNIVITGGDVTADFEYSLSGDEATFTDTSTADCDIATWSWDFGDGIGTSSSQNPVYTYGSGGTHTVTLTTCDVVGNCDTISHDVVGESCYLFDFTLDDYDFVAWSGSGTTYIGGVGWSKTLVNDNPQPSIYLDLPTSCQISSMELTYYITGTGTVVTVIGSLATSNGTFNPPSSNHESHFGGESFSGFGTDIILTKSFDNTTVNTISAVAGTESIGLGTYTAIIKSLKITGTGVNQFGSDNC